MASRQKDSKTYDQRGPHPNDPKILEALNAMQCLGLSSVAVKPVLNNLLKLYGGSWELIEEDNYRTLADAIFESLDDKKRSKAVVVLNEEEPPPKKSHLRKYEDQGPSTMKNGNKISPERGQIKRKRHQNDESHEDKKPRTVDLEPRNPTGKRLFHKIKDITKGTENMKISLIDEIGIDLPKFHYIPQNTSYQDAYVHFSLARIADDGCCIRCSGNCLSSRVPCACSRETGGEFAYTSQGLLKDEFLEACISNPQQEHNYFHCQDCPVERTRNAQNPEPCKGHLLKKFIKECWRKCGCNMDCGNRVVQRGITCELQVFSMEGKGWGLRTLKNLPKGSFVCEYIGEILTNTELYNRNKQNRRSNERHTYPVTLDSDWGSEQVLKDEEALCLDATNYGNVGRFINHRCYDSNLIEIPVEIETPDHHYYHIAFFTRRNVEAYEELTWDYGIDFADEGHPIKAFKCECGSSSCRDVKREATGAKKKELGIKRHKSGTSR